ncbi:DUF1153 domain-containing protein [Ralstonia mannitolilytica]|uniref:DUF1153 domain-containing protein n=1 Tax=Ralstonia mannitolilytica TaxID=105219 RepID=A0AAJ5D478_9RALS|nr:hypothetical protein LMG6866_04079 [Ralstonia mannitolilytica]CAJ0738017.1 hypothetical protein R77592_04499 [Ralstonia mannitolilytica]SUD86992.1 Uncharacterised protein [Ralstonia mannitolilytica]SUD92915.1 Uncharacterised protein [Ralstonia mannitolilytica]SUD96653.1 Uncharacterised protein [Ralstonia mannitolilytica]
MLGIIKGEKTLAEASRAADLSPSEIEHWVDNGKRGVETALGATPLDMKEQYDGRSRICRKQPARRMLELRTRKKCSPC